MRVLRCLATCALLGAFAPCAWAGDLYSYVDEEGVVHFSNAPSDGRYRKLRTRSGGGGIYRVDSDGSETRVAAAPGGGGQGGTRTIARTKGEAIQKYREHIKAAAEKYQLPEALLMAVMAVESGFNDRALSEKGAMGLMQLMPSTAQAMYVGDAWAPEQNIDGGARYLRILANQYNGDIVKTLAAYNAGPEAVRRAGDTVPNIPETREYVRRVVALYQSFRAGL